MAAILTDSTVTGVSSETAISGTTTLTVQATANCMIEVQVENGSTGFITIDTITGSNAQYAKTLITGAVDLRLNVKKNEGTINANIV